MSEANRKRWSGNDPRRAKLRELGRSVRNGVTPYEDREWLRSRYEDRGMSLRQIAAEAQCGLRTIARWMATHNISTRDNLSAIALRPSFKGPDSPHWKGGHHCSSCGAPNPNRGSKRCRPCHTAYSRGPNNPNWKGLADVMTLVRQWSFDNWRPRVFERDRFTCQKCGDDRGGNLHAHHIEPLSILVDRKRSWLRPDLTSPTGRWAFVQRLLVDPDITSIENGVTLCEDCHRDAHDGLYIPHKRENPHRPKLSLEDRAEIVQMYASGGISQKRLGEIFGVKQAHVSHIVRQAGITVGRGSRHATEQT